MPTHYTRPGALFALLAALALPVSGCDFLSDDDDDDVSVELTSQQLEDVRDLLDAEFGCDEVEATRLGRSESDALTSGDCTDGEFTYDVYAFRVSGSTDVQIDLESNEFDAVLTLLDEDLNEIDFNDDRSNSNTDARLETRLSSGVYVVFAYSYDGDLGDYELQLDGDSDGVTAGEPATSSAKPAARIARARAN